MRSRLSAFLRYLKRHKLLFKNHESLILNHESLRKLLFWKHLHGNQKLAFYVGLAVLLIVFIPLALETFQNMKRAEAAWFNDNWQYRKSLTFTHNADVANTKVKFDIDTTSAPDNFQADCGDVRFTDENGNLLDYFYDSANGACDTSSTDFYVLMPSIINGENLMYMYYGNTAVANGTVASQFSQATTTPSGGAATVGSEEKSLGPTYYWKLDEGYGTTANNSASSSAATRGTLTNMDTSGASNSGWLTEDSCISGRCLGLDGVNDRVVTQALPATEDTTAEVWIKAGPLTTANRMILSQGGSNSSTNINWRFYLSTTGTIVFQVYRYTGAVTTQSTQTYDDNKWHHVVVVISGTTTSIYVDGVLIKTGTAPAYVVKTSLINIGVAPGNVFPFLGTIDDVKIYTYARSAAQIKADYASRGGVKGTSAVLGSSSLSSLGDGLIGYWKQNEATWSGQFGEVVDSSGNSNSGQAQGAANALAYPSTGKFGNGGLFDGVDDYVTVPATSMLNSASFSTSMWVKPNTLRVQGLINKNSYASSWRLFMRNTSGNLEFDSTSDTYNLNSTTNLVANQWSHVVVTFDSVTNTMRIYINGVLDNSLVTGADIGGAFSGQLNIGTTTTVGQNILDGTLDEIRMYNRTLTSSEVAEIYNYAPGPLAQWKMEERDGITANDSSGNNYTGTLTSGPTWASGRVGSAVKFDGSNDYIDMGDNLDMPDKMNFTLTGWFKTNSLASAQTIVGKKNGIGATAIGYTVRLTANGRINAYVNDGAHDYNMNSSDVLKVNTWYHFAVVWNEASEELSTIYINGIEDKGTTTGTLTDVGDMGVVNTNTITFKIGQSSSTNYFNGIIDQVEVFNYALSQKQVLADLQAGSANVTASGKTNVGYWKFDEGYGTVARDSSPYNRSGTFSGSSLPIWKNDGKFNKALFFNGTAAYISMGNVDQYNIASASSFTAWIKLTDIASQHDIISKKGAAGQRSYMLTVNSSGKLRFETSSDGTNLTSVVGTTTFSPNIWYHVAGVYVPSVSQTIYINGVKEATNTSSIPASTFIGTGNLEIGSENIGGGRMAGMIDEVKVYAGDLTPDEIKQEYNRGAAIQFGSTGTDPSGVASNSADRAYCPPGDTTASCAPVGEWNFEEGSGTSVNDTTGNGNTGTISGPKYTQGMIGKGVLFNGGSDVITVANTLSTKSVVFWVYPTSTTANLIDLRTAATVTNISVSGGTISATGFPATTTIYVNGIVSSTLVANKWQQVAVTTTGTAISANAIKFGNIGAGTGMTGKIDAVKFYDYTRSAAQVAWDYNRGLPVAYWKLDECQGTNVYDSSGFGNTGAITIGASGTYTSVGSCGTSSASSAWYNGLSGKRNYSLAFDGTDEYVSFSRSSSIQSIATQGSIAGWVYYNSLDSSLRTFVDIASSGVNGLIFLSNNGSNVPRLQYGTGGSTQSINSTRTFATGTWYYLVGTWDSGGGKLYVNGTLDSSSATAPSITVSSGTAYIGAQTANQRYHDGKIDDVKIFNYPLTLQQVKALYNGGTINYGPVTGAP